MKNMQKMDYHVFCLQFWSDLFFHNAKDTDDLPIVIEMWNFKTDATVDLRIYNAQEK